MPKVYPLESLRISRSVKYAKSPNNLFVIIENDRFIFFVVNQDYIIPSNEISSMQHTIKVIKNILNLPNYFILESNENELGNFGTVAFEVRYKEIHGMEFTNSLLQDSCRIVTECQLLRKKSFRNVVEMLKYYKISYTFEQDSSVLNKDIIYTPILSKDTKENIICKLNKVYPKCEDPEIDSENSDSSQNDYYDQSMKNAVLTTDPQISDTSSFIFKGQEHQNIQLTPPKSKYKIVINDERKYSSEVKNILEISDAKEIDPNQEPEFISEILIRNVTLQAYYDDPLLPYRMREVIVK